jgi:hydrogenase nickel incorporation protein HypA/HybF
LHELSVATQIVGIVKRVMEEHSATRVGEVTVDVGTLSCIDGSSLEFCFEAITKGTDMEGARLKIEEITPKAKCRTCNREYDVRRDDFRCRFCGSEDFDVLVGSEISIRQVEVE